MGDRVLGNGAAELRRLTAREREVLELAAEGARDAEIAHAFHVEVTTVKTHLRSCYRKLEVDGRMAATRVLLIDQKKIVRTND